jgi:putative glutamine amidotransferase
LLLQAETTPVAIDASEPLPPHARALLVAGDGPFGLAEEPVPVALAEALSAGLPVLGIEWGMQALSAAFGGRPPVEVAGHAPGHGQSSQTLKHRIFLTMGGKVASVIGGAGVVSVPGRHRYSLTEGRRGKGLMTTAFGLDDGVVEALEMPGAHWVIGVQWPAFLVEDLPAGFANLIAAFAGEASPAGRTG